MALFSVSSFIKLPSILLEICSGQKCDGQTDKAATRYSPLGEHKNLVMVGLVVSEEKLSESMDVRRMVDNRARLSYKLPRSLWLR